MIGIRSHGAEAAFWDTDGRATLSMGLACVLLFLVLNPFLAVFVLALMAPFRRVPTAAFVIAASISFAVFFSSREYGIEWYVNSTDDVPAYMYLYRQFEGTDLSELVADFIAAPNGHELLWELPWWGLMQVVGVSDERFVLLHYLVIFTAVFLALSTFSRKYLTGLVVVYFFLTPISIDSISHIWRQQLAFSMFVGGLGLYLIRGRRAGIWLVFLSPLMHVSMVFFLAAFLTFQALKRFGGFTNKLRFSLALVLIMAVVPFLSTMAVAYLDAMGLARIMSYFEGYGTDVFRVYMILLLYVTPLLGAFYFLKNDDSNNLFMFLCFAVFSIVSAIPAANGIYDRLLMFVLPLSGLYFFRCMLINFGARYYLPLIVLTFVSGVARLYLPTLVQSGPMYFLAYGRAWDPFMGLIKLVLNA